MANDNWLEFTAHYIPASQIKIAGQLTYANTLIATLNY